ncbi:30S ribosomal protein S6 [Mycoplasma wenyonii str. Massachusetts]|uniref:Small ribosomal subunit protein bS6 n=1 Tax=Mycoplasma wenyonii (strain Massachusetts) TaxID=1197325 RepID=I6ZE54_MYCWM|nr:30S ribosomal protein S6 [Mycoplasma wenyonii]AFN64827.1 30S ribosomal protein S6 [Mycoplasma wenyonii str. Massachusetts]
MFLVDPSCSEEESEQEVSPLLELFRGEEDYSETVTWSDKLAYPIKHKTEAHRYLINFYTSESEKLERFNTLSNLNPKILRHLIINIEKNYGYRASVNPKKIQAAERRAQKYQEFKARKQRTGFRLGTTKPV